MVTRAQNRAAMRWYDPDQLDVCEHDWLGIGYGCRWQLGIDDAPLWCCANCGTYTNDPTVVAS